MLSPNYPRHQAATTLIWWSPLLHAADATHIKTPSLKISTIIINIRIVTEASEECTVPAHKRMSLWITVAQPKHIQIKSSTYRILAWLQFTFLPLRFSSALTTKAVDCHKEVSKRETSGKAFIILNLSVSKNAAYKQPHHNNHHTPLECCFFASGLWALRKYMMLSFI